jgi:D-alanyl-D-alanine carboxypeptidase
VKGTTYIDKTVKKGEKYRYTVKAFSGSFTSAYDSEGVLLKYMAVNGQTIYGKNAKYQRPGTINKPTTIKIDEDNWNLTVVNTGYRIPSDYEPDLVYVCGSGERLDRKVAVQYEKMYKAAAKEGVYLTPCSGYRSYELQERNYNRKVDYYKSQGYSTAQAKVKAATSIMPPGSSEHNLGYAMDIVCVEEYFEDSKQFKWLQKNAADYGFILRYPKNKQNVTKVIYEPWHWRYVGVDAAKAMKSSGLTLEEYMGVTK